MKHANILPSHDVDQLARLNMPDLYKVRLKRKYVRVGQGECVGIPLPADLPVGARSPAVAVDEEGEIAVVEEEFSVQAFDVDGFDVFSPRDEVEGRVGLVQQGLCLGGFQTDDFETAGAADAES